MPIIEPIKYPEGKAARLLESVERNFGATPNIFKTLANSPEALEAYLNLQSALSNGKLPKPLRESIALAVAGFNGCDYCASAHTYLGDKLGIGQEELAANLRGKSSDPKTAAALGFSMVILETHGHPSKKEVAKVRAAGFSIGETIEILSFVSLNVFTNYFNETFGVEVDFPPIRAKQKAA